MRHFKNFSSFPHHHHSNSYRSVVSIRRRNWTVVERMEIFDTLQKHLRFLGIYHPKPPEKLKNILLNITLMLLLFWLILSALWFFLFEEKSFSDFAVSFYIVMTALLNFFTYSTFLWQKSKFLRLLDDIKQVIQKR